MDEFLTIRTFTFPTEAEIVKGRLESEGIECLLKDELTTQVISLYSNAMGGVKLQVKKSDIPKAIELLKETGYLTDEDFQSPKYLQQFDTATSYIPIIKNLTIWNRVFALAGCIVVITGIIYYFVTLPTLKDKLLNKTWCVDEIKYNGSQIKLNTSTITGDCNESMYFSKEYGYGASDDHGYVDLPGIYTSNWQYSDNAVTISSLNLDSLSYVYNGTYTVQFKTNTIILQSNTTTIYGHLR